MFTKIHLKDRVGKRQVYRRISKRVSTEMKNIYSIVDNDTKHSNITSNSNSKDILDNDDDSSSNDNNINIENAELHFELFAECVDNVNKTNVSESCVEKYTDAILNNSVELPLMLKNWVCTENVPHSSVTKLLHLLKPYHPNLPLDCRTLLKTPRVINIKSLPNGEYVHFNVNIMLINILSKTRNIPNVLELSINIDGLPLFHSSNTQFWPILALIKNICGPFVIGIFCGMSKPEPLSLFLEDFISDISELLKNGVVYNNITYLVRIHSFICDAPARAYIKCTKVHTGYAACDKCTEYGNYVNRRVVFKNSSANKRTDESFVLQLDEEHHTGISPLLVLNIGLVSLFPIDYMHAVCLGVMRKLLITWIGGNLNIRFRAQSVHSLSESLKFLREFVPYEINRKPRSISELSRWKATELRTFLLYLGPAILKKVWN